MLDEAQMNEYLESISLFYDEKIKFLSRKDNYISCNDCPKNKEIIENFDEVTLSCGGDDKDKKCGVKINIKFAKYLFYEKDIQILKDKLNEGINLDIINKYINIINELKEKQIKDSLIEEKLREITEQFYQINIENKKEKIHQFYINRIEKTKRCKEIKHKLNNNSLDEQSKTILRKEYVSIIKLLNEEYSEIKILIDNFNPHIMIKKPIVSIDIKGMDEKKTKKKKKKTKKEKGKEKNNKDTIGNIVKHIISCNGYKTKDQLIKIWGEVGEGDVNLSPLYKLVKENLVLKNIEWREKEDPPIVQASIQQYISGYKRFKNNLTKKDCKETKKEKGKEDNFIFTKGDKVWWEEGSNIIEGNIAQNIKKKKKLINIIKEDGKEYYIPFDKLIKGIHEPEPEPELEPIPDQEILYYSNGSDDNKWLSTFNVEIPFKYNDIEYPSVENAFQAQKLENDHPINNIYKELFSTYNYKTLPSEKALKLSESYLKENNYTIRSDWDKIKSKLMEEITILYYDSNSEMKSKLLDTKNKVLIHKGRNIDDYWGVTTKDDRGQNIHGKILMKIRDKLIKED